MSTRLPGLLAQTELVGAVDAYGAIVTPGVDHYSVRMQSEASGNDLVDAVTPAPRGRHPPLPAE